MTGSGIDFCDYFAAPANSYWQWQEQGSVIAWSDGTTIAFRGELKVVLERIRTHRNNIARYWRLLRSELSDSERSSIERRLAEERAALNALAAETFPHAITPAAKQFQASAA